MNGPTRLLRGGLLALAAGTVGLVAATLRPPAPASPTPTPSPSTAPASRMEGFVYRGFKQDRESYVLRADRYVGREKDQIRLGGVELAFAYTAQHEAGRGSIASDECTYTPSQERAVFVGRVHLTTEDGLELRTDSLTYFGDRGLARTEDPVEFRQGRLSGRSRGILYRAEHGKLELPAEALLRLEGEGGPPVEIESGQAMARRDGDILRFLRGVKVTQGGDSLTAGRLIATFSWSDQRLHRAEAIDDVDLRTAGGGRVPGTTGPLGATGARRLTSRRLEFEYRPDRTLERAVATGDAVLTTEPAPGERRERRRLRGDVLTFGFDEQGRLASVASARGSEFEAWPLPPTTGASQSVKCVSLVAQIEPTTGEIVRIDFKSAVELLREGQRATAQEAAYEAASGTLALRKDPELVDDARGSRLRAASIDVGTESGDLRAAEGVRHLLEPKQDESGLLGSEGAPTLVTSRTLIYDAKTKTARYEGDALLRSGRNEVRGPEVRIQEGSDGRRLTAVGGVASVFTPKATAPRETALPVEARAREMFYEETRQQITYTGDVALKQGDISTRSPVAVVTLTRDGDGIQSLVAGEPVEVQQAGRVATGSRATYLPGSETLQLVGEAVVLKDPGREVRGRSLTFHVGEDRILVDGREEVRTETVFRKELPRP